MSAGVVVGIFGMFDLNGAILIVVCLGKSYLVWLVTTPAPALRGNYAAPTRRRRGVSHR